MCWEEALLCYYVAWQLLYASDGGCVVPQKRISPGKKELLLNCLKRTLHTEYLKLYRCKVLIDESFHRKAILTIC